MQTIHLHGESHKLIFLVLAEESYYILELFSESADNALTDGPCCDVCQNSENYRTEDYKKELKILLDALECIGLKGEVKVGEWIRGSAISWTNQYNKESLSYGNHQGHDVKNFGECL